MSSRVVNAAIPSTYGRHPAGLPPVWFKRPISTAFRPPSGVGGVRTPVVRVPSGGVSAGPASHAALRWILVAVLLAYVPSFRYTSHSFLEGARVMSIVGEGRGLRHKHRPVQLGNQASEHERRRVLLGTRSPRSRSLSRLSSGSAQGVKAHRGTHIRLRVETKHCMAARGPPCVAQPFRLDRPIRSSAHSE
jgi:hypothetical protein